MAGKLFAALTVQGLREALISTRVLVFRALGFRVLVFMGLVFRRCTIEADE